MPKRLNSSAFNDEEVLIMIAIIENRPSSCSGANHFDCTNKTETFKSSFRIQSFSDGLFNGLFNSHVYLMK